MKALCVLITDELFIMFYSILVTIYTTIQMSGIGNFIILNFFLGGGGYLINIKLKTINQK